MNLSDYTRILGQARMSRSQKVKASWSGETGAGFIKNDILNIESIGKMIEFTFSWGQQTLGINELNLRETEELIDFCKEKVGINHHEVRQREHDKRFELIESALPNQTTVTKN